MGVSGRRTTATASTKKSTEPASSSTVTTTTIATNATLKLSQLQSLCKRDPSGYRFDYDAQVRRLESECAILALNPSSSSTNIEELIQFVAAVASSSYKGEESDRVSYLLMDLLVGGGSSGGQGSAAARAAQAAAAAVSSNINKKQSRNGKKGLPQKSKASLHQDMVSMTTPSSSLQLLNKDVRKSCVSALILMRNKGAIPPLRLLELFFRIMAVVSDKALRELLYRHVVNDIRNLNQKGKRDDAVNRAIQSFLHRVVSTHGTTVTSEGEDTATNIAAKRATDMVCELYRRQVWTDDRTVAILASAVVSKNATVMARAMRFFLNIEEKMALDKREKEDEVWDASQKVDFHRFSKKTVHRQRHVNRQLKNRQKQQRKREGLNSDEWMDIRDDTGVDDSKKLYPAIELLRDPQGLAEAVFTKLKQPRSVPFKLKLLMMNFVTRLVGNHELMVLPLYTFLQKYMGGQQKDVTAVLAYTVQACHVEVPPEDIYGILKTIAHNFVTERCSEEQMAVGINAIRAIMGRVPAVMAESADDGSSTAFDVEAFVRDICGYANHRDRSVSIAGKAFMNFIRETYPSLLQGKDRGLKGSALHKHKIKPMRYGESQASSGVAGADLLVEYESKQRAWLLKQAEGEEEEDVDADEEMLEPMNDAATGDTVVEESDDEEAPELVKLDPASIGDNSGVIDLSKMTRAEREELKQKVSSTRIFSASDFAKMRKLVAREERAKRDPREAARRKRAIAQGRDFEELTDDDNSDDDDSSEDEAIHIKGAVNPGHIMAEATRKRKSKAEKLQKVLAGRDKFETKGRAGGSTNTEKERRKNFFMSKSSKGARSKGRGKGGLTEQRGTKQKGHEAKKRRRRM